MVANQGKTHPKSVPTLWFFKSLYFFVFESCYLRFTHVSNQIWNVHFRYLSLPPGIHRWLVTTPCPEISLHHAREKFRIRLSYSKVTVNEYQTYSLLNNRSFTSGCAGASACEGHSVVTYVSLVSRISPEMNVSNLITNVCESELTTLKNKKVRVIWRITALGHFSGASFYH